MTRSWLRSGEAMDYQSERIEESKTSPGVRFTIGRMSLGRRIELTRRVWELAKRVEFLEAGEGAKDKLEAALVRGEIDRTYLKWGLIRIEGLMVDGEPGSPEKLIEAGPEDLCREVLTVIRAECGLNEDERKN